MNFKILKNKIKKKLPLISDINKADLNDVGLYLADWGYNTAQMRQKVAQDTRIKLLSLSQFAADFTHW